MSTKAQRIKEIKLLFAKDTNVTIDYNGDVLIHLEHTTLYENSGRVLSKTINKILKLPEYKNFNLQANSGGENICIRFGFTDAKPKKPAKPNPADNFFRDWDRAIKQIKMR